ncbi:MAG TPA: response regulator transcription factor [Gammaproteobacteria bacterium]|nr:response regulator transcription factor [Gammaproteobacteria bacterium]
MSVRVLLADDHLILRQGLRAILERSGMQVVAEAGDGMEAVRLTTELKPTVVVLDLAMPVLNGLDAAREIQRDAPETAIILLTMHTEEQYILAALQAGVKGYVVKTQAAEDLVHAVEQVCSGTLYLSAGVSQVVTQAYLKKTEPSSEPLTPRERQVLQLVAEGKTTKEIARMLEISVKTAESHRTRVMDKLDIHDVAGLVRYAIRRGLIQA